MKLDVGHKSTRRGLRHVARIEGKERYAFDKHMTDLYIFIVIYLFIYNHSSNYRVDNDY